MKVRVFMPVKEKGLKLRRLNLQNTVLAVEKMFYFPEENENWFLGESLSYQLA